MPLGTFFRLANGIVHFHRETTQLRCLLSDFFILLRAVIYLIRRGLVSANRPARLSRTSGQMRRASKRRQRQVRTGLTALLFRSAEGLLSALIWTIEQNPQS